jgi:hypothetical protein
MLGMWGSARDDVWAVGLEGSLVHFDGKAWTRVASNVKDNLWSVWGSGRNDVWAVGANATLLRFDGKAWTAVPVSDRTR